MDAHDLFRQLTRGVKFTKRNNAKVKVRNYQSLQVRCLTSSFLSECRFEFTRKSGQTR